MAELSENMNVFHDVKVNLITVISIHRMGGFLLKIYKVFHSVDFTLFTKRKMFPQKTARNSETKWKIRKIFKVTQSSQYFTLNLYDLKIIYTLLENCV